MTRRDQRWNHNIHYHRLILQAVPPGCQRVLDVGCGEGALARQLARLVPHVVGIDQDAASIDLARRQNPDGEIGFIRGDFLTHPFAAASFSMITSVAALHHMDARAAFDQMSQLLAPGGTLVIVGLARSRLPADLPWEAAAVTAHQGHKLTRTYWEQPSPTIWPATAHLRRNARACPADAPWRAVPAAPAVALLADLDQAVTSGDGKQQFEQQRRRTAPDGVTSDRTHRRS